MKIPVINNIFIANIYNHYWRVLQLIASVLDAIYRFFPGFKVMSNWSVYEIYTKVDLFDMEINVFWKKKEKWNGLYSPRLENSKSFNPKQQGNLTEANGNI